MKIRSGFVSNSSTSSFVGYGIVTTEEAVMRAIEEATEEKFDPEDAYAWDKVYEILDSYSLEVACPYDTEVVVGKRLDRMKGTETRNEFFERTFNALEKVLGTEMASGVEIIDVAWRDG